VMACATALAGSQVPLAVLPLGTGNLVATNFDIPTDLDRALETALPRRRRRIDLGAIGDGRFVIAAGMGFDAAMLRDASHGLKARIGSLAYVWSAWGTCAQPVQFDGDTVEPTDRLDLEVDPSSLTLAVPQHHQDQTPPVRADSD
jgi:diacylglycerol kinase family enzyme